MLGTRPVRSALVLCLAVATAAPAAAQVSKRRAATPLDARVARAALGTYVHGMTPELAERLVGRQGVPSLRRLLADESFPRRDNVVAMLACLDEGSAREDLLGLLADSPSGALRPEDDRALLLVPEALGRLAARGDERSLELLLAWTRDGAPGGVLVKAARVASDPASMHRDLLESALRGLARADSAPAHDRLLELAGGAAGPKTAGASLRTAAESALRLRDELLAGSPLPGGQLDGPGLRERGGDPLRPPEPAAEDVAARWHELSFSFANHADHDDPMSDSRLDAVLAEGSLLLGRADSASDVSCCVSAVREGSGLSFGAPADGLDVIDDDAELRAVLTDSSARFKVVRAIRYCAGPGTNVIGCGWVGGNGIAVVRMSHLVNEARLWMHEYGHNAGLSHSSDSTAIMYGAVNGTNETVSAAECEAFHAPPAGTAMAPADVGACADQDGDAVHDGVDNCPFTANADQADADFDGIGDACESAAPPAAECGNGLREEGEDCDGSDLGGADCLDLGFDGGQLACDSGCGFDVSSCTTDPPPPACPDADGDGWQDASCNSDPAAGGGDCDDSDARVHPGAFEQCGDGIDQDCSGRDKKCPRGGGGGGGGGGKGNGRNK